MFDKRKIYTAVNADELHVGDTVYVADTIAELRDRIGNEEYARKLVHIFGEGTLYRFCVKSIKDVNLESFKYGGFALAYLVERGGGTW